MAAYTLQVVLDGDGINEVRDETYFCGTNAVLKTIRSKQEAYVVLSLDNFIVIQADTNRDGNSDVLTVAQRDRSGIPSILLHVFQRDAKGIYRPVPESQLKTMQRDAVKGADFVRNSGITSYQVSDRDTLPSVSPDKRPTATKRARGSPKTK